MSYLTVQETSRGDYPEPPPLVPCLLLMTWMRESLPRHLIMVSQLYLYKGFVFIFSFFFKVLLCVPYTYRPHIYICNNAPLPLQV